MSSLTWQWKAFQEFQPIGGVFARPLSEAFAGSAAAREMSARQKKDNTFFRVRDKAVTSTSGFTSMTDGGHFMEVVGLALGVSRRCGDIPRYFFHVPRVLSTLTFVFCARPTQGKRGSSFWSFCSHDQPE